MRRTVLTAEVAAQLGHDAQMRGFVPGAVVDIVISCVPGVIMLTLADDADSIDVKAKPLPGPARAALTRGMAR